MPDSGVASGAGPLAVQVLDAIEGSRDLGSRGAPATRVSLDVEGRLHIRFEDTILCTETGYECLTPLDILPWEADKLLEMRDAKKPIGR